MEYSAFTLSMISAAMEHEWSSDDLSHCEYLTVGYIDRYRYVMLRIKVAKYNKEME